VSAPEPRSPLAAALKPGRSGAETASIVTLSERRRAIAQVQSRNGQEAQLAEALARALNLTLPGPGHASLTGALAAIWIQPAAWLVVEPFTGPGELAQRLAASAGGLAAVTDQTFGKTVLSLSGARARDVLAKGCRLDLHPRVFSPGCAGVSPLAGISCVVVQTDGTPSFDLIVPSTFAAAVFEWLETAAAEFGCNIAAS
jgi:heterotetrameric sarcosine oxidase gamma subunit